MNVKKLAVSGILAVSLLAGCGGNVDTASENIPAPVESIETTVDDPEVDDGNVTDPGEVSDISGTSAEESPVIENPTFVQTGDHEYTIYVDCPDNSNAPELSFIAENDTVHALEGATVYGPSENLINAVMTHGMQVDPLNPAQINYDAYMDKPFEFNMPILGTRTVVITNNPSDYDESAKTFTMEQIVSDEPGFIPVRTYDICAILLEDSIVNTNGNLSCALARYNMGPEDWTQVMEECMSATGLTAEQIYANCDSEFVLPYDTQGLGEPDYVVEVLSYIAPEDSIEIMKHDEKGDLLPRDTYIIVRTN